MPFEDQGICIRIKMQVSTSLLSVLLLLPIIEQHSAIGLSPVPLILDTDIGPYPDDVGAFSILHTAADHGVIDIRAIMGNNRYEGIVPVIEAMNRYFNRTSIQIGVTKDPNAYCNSGNYSWPEYVVKHYPHPMYRQNADAEDAVTLYRRILATSDDRSVTILSIGHFINLANLLKSKPDQYSPLSGQMLVKRKVDRMVAMAGQFPRGDEWNIVNDINSSRSVVAHWPTPVLYVGFEVGEKIHCGQNLLNNSRLENSPVRKAFEFAYKKDGFLDGCFDEIGALVTVRGLAPLYGLVYGDIEIMPNGTDVWHAQASKTPNAHIKQVATDQAVLDTINPLLAR